VLDSVPMGSNYYDVLMSAKPDEQFSDEETQRRFEAALRGAREVGHEPMKDISPKRSKPQAKASMKVGPSALSGADKSKRRPK
jgi:hypothetical protein